eukprot:GILK01003213.1.p1 GENE.GILK01003213.1~~GILK01003213.1.p1  ORF type:complete len:506 (+),score=50.12 GILK01003213.1:43-1518(+)
MAERLTKAALKQLLTSKDIPLPATDQKKPFYVDLYKQNKDKFEGTPARPTARKRSVSTGRRRSSVPRPVELSPSPVKKGRPSRSGRSKTPVKRQSVAGEQFAQATASPNEANLPFQEPERRKSTRRVSSTELLIPAVPPVSPPSALGSEVQLTRQNPVAVQEFVNPKLFMPRYQKPSEDETNMSQVWMAVLIAAAVLLVTLLYIWFVPTKPFCDTGYTGDISHCKPCPSGGICVRGELTCSSPLVREGDQCVQDKDLPKNAARIVQYIEKHLSELAGMQECGYVPSAEMTGEELKAAAKLEFESMVNFDATFAAALRSIQATDYLSQGSIHVQRQNPTAPLRLSSKTPVIPFTCRLQRGLLEHLWAIVSTVFVLFVSLIVVSRMKRKSSDARLAREIFVGIRQELEEQAIQGKFGGAPESHIRESYVDNLGEDVVSRIWPMVSEMRSKDPRIREVEGLTTFGYPGVMWEWVSEMKTTPHKPIRTPSFGALL